MQRASMSDKFNILITGGAGYLGSTMVPMFLHAGHSVTVIDNFLFKQNSLAQVCHKEKFDVVNGDCRDENLLKPLAAIVGAPACNRDRIGAESTNLGAIRSLLKLSSKEQRFLTPITNSGYGIGEAGKFCTEETPLNPISWYGKTKVMAEEEAFARGNAISFRLATVFGMSPRMRIDLLVNDFTYRAINDRALVLFESHFKRNFIHVRDVARAFLHGIDNFGTMKDQAYNVGLSDANLSKWELCEVIKTHVPDFYFVEAEVGEDPDKRDYIVSNAKIEATGFKPAYGLDQGVPELIKGYRMIKNSIYGNV